jgi:hypothetical protein
VRVAGIDGPKLGLGFETVTEYDPGSRIAEAGTAAVSCVELTKVGIMVFPKNAESTICTVDPLRNPLPFSVIVNPGPPELTFAGEIDVRVGVG